jgi:hypothetical protein
VNCGLQPDELRRADGPHAGHHSARSVAGPAHREGETLASVSLPLGKAEESGRLLAIGRVPLAKIPPGKYRLQITIGSGIDARIRTAPLTVVD